MDAPAAATFRRELTIRGAFDRRHPDPSKNYGIHGMEMRFVLVGPKGATHFLVYTPIHLPHVADELYARERSDYNPFRAQGADIGYHSPTPRYEGQRAVDCDVLGGQCYTDGTALGADRFLPEFLAGGSDAVWPMLEQRYRELFEDDAHV